MTGPPEGCTCTWSSTSEFGAIYLADKDCPSMPHERTWSADLLVADWNLVGETIASSGAIDPVRKRHA